MPKTERSTKRQHYVPQLYLKKFVDIKGRLFVFNKPDSRVFPVMPNNIAHERYFNDVPPEFLPLLPVGVDVQFLEKRLADIEGNLRTGLDNFLKRLENYKKSKNIFRPEHRNCLSLFIILQYIRTKENREKFIHLFEQMDKASFQSYKNTIKDFSPELNSAYAAFLQSQLLLDGPQITNMQNQLLNHIWFVGKNETDLPLYTSDNPVTVRPYKTEEDGSIKETGLFSTGTEITFPLGPKYIIVLYERTFHKQMLSKNGQVIPLQLKHVKYFNHLQVAQSSKQVYCSEDNFDLAREVCAKNPIFADPNRPRIETIHRIIPPLLER